MERTLTSDEKIKRAEEIYYRKKMQNTNKKSARVNVSHKKDFGMFKKMILQMFICILIYVAFYIVKNTNYIFLEGVIKRTNEILSYDINIKNLYEQYSNYIKDIGATIGRPQEENVEQKGIIENETNENTIIQDSENENINSTEGQNIGEEDIELKEETVELTQMEKDAKYILENESLIIPLKGTITSRFGLRNPDTPTVPKNHTGIDIAANEGTVFIASMEGVVEEVSSERRSR